MHEEKYLNSFLIKYSLKRKNIKYIKKDEWEIKSSENIIGAITPRRFQGIGRWAKGGEKETSIVNPARCRRALQQEEGHRFSERCVVWEAETKAGVVGDAPRAAQYHPALYLSIPSFPGRSPTGASALWRLRGSRCYDLCVDRHHPVVVVR